MAFSADASPRDPYKTMRFRVYKVGGDSDPIGASKVSPLKRTIAPIEFRSGGDRYAPRVMPGNAKYEPVTIDVPLTDDSVVRRLADLLGDLRGTPGAPGFRYDMVLELLDDAGNSGLKYQLKECWISDFQAVPELDANSPAVAVQQIVVQYHGFELI